MEQNETDIAKREKVITCMLTCSSLEQAAQESGVGRTTIYRWLKEPDFKDTLRRRRNEIVDAEMDAIKAHVGKARETLVKLLDSDADSIKRFAAKDILEYTCKIRELQDLGGRLATIEVRLKQRKD